ncbi:MAG TPA: transporter substrate-binding domain-containing protein [Candidatus Limnocylindria bacterium]|nr:transporter substrate-binding domain-containing protein [Candidatus Limnocylindria bacterium]
MARRSNAARRDASAARRRKGIRSQPLGHGATLAASALLAAACLHPRPAAPPLRVGTSGDYPPFSLARDGTFEGLDVEVARRFAKDSGRRLELVPFRWPELTRDLAAGRFDLAMGGVTLRPERAVVGVFTRPVAEAGAVVLAHQRLDPRSAWLRLGVNAGGHLERLAARLFPRALLVRTHDNRALAELLTSGAADAILTDELEADALAVSGTLRLGPFTRDRKGYLGRDPALVAELDAWLRAREADGTLAGLRSRWLGPERARARSAVASDLDALLALVDLRLAFMPGVAAAKQKSGRPVEDPGQEARVLAAVRARGAERGLDPAAVEALFRAQIDAARALEQDWLAHPWEVDALDLEQAARPALARISELIVDRVADLAADRGAPAAPDPARVAEALDGSLASAPRRRAIAEAIAHLRASPLSRREKTGVCQRRMTRLEAGRQRPIVADPDQKSRANSEASAVSLR